MTFDSAALALVGSLGTHRPPTAPAPTASPPPEPSWLARVGDLLHPYTHAAFTSIEEALRWASSRTGLPTIVVAALGMVLAFRVARRTWHVIFELALAFALLFAATRMGWIRW